LLARVITAPLASSSHKPATAAFLAYESQSLLTGEAVHPEVRAEIECTSDSFELAFSRFGIMFFSDPVAAFENVRRAMKPGDRLALAVFRAASETLWPNAHLKQSRSFLMGRSSARASDLGRRRV
jgi:SAM-dependent methyltransferase